jgi:hypothetical protein
VCILPRTIDHEGIGLVQLNLTCIKPMKEWNGCSWRIMRRMGVDERWT